MAGHPQHPGGYPQAVAIPSGPSARCNGTFCRCAPGLPRQPAALWAKRPDKAGSGRTWATAPPGRYPLTAAGAAGAQAEPRPAAPPPTGIRSRAWDATANGSPDAPQACTPTFPPSTGRAGAKSPPPAPNASRSDNAGAPAQRHRRPRPRRKPRNPPAKPRKIGSFSSFHMRKQPPANQAPISIRRHYAKKSKIPLACCAFLRRVCPVDSKSAVQKPASPEGDTSPKRATKNPRPAARTADRGTQTQGTTPGECTKPKPNTELIYLKSDSKIFLTHILIF